MVVIIMILIPSLSGCSLNTGMDEGPAASETPSPSDMPVQPIDTPSPTPEPTPACSIENEIEEILSSMSLEEKLGQLLVVGYQDDEQARRMIRDYGVGGMVLFSRSFDTFEQLYSINEQLKEYNRDNQLPLWIALDEEGGTVSRLPKGKTPIPGAAKVGSFNDTELTRSTGWVIGRELAAAGANLDFAPVVDIGDNPENKFMIKRSYGSTPELVSEHGTAFLQGLKETGVQGCAKHFPGHGGTIVDSHKNMPVISSTLEEWLQKDAIPFQAMIDAGVDMIMAGHLSFPNIDQSGLPASMSQVFLQDLLRNRMGFEGLIITDDIEMQGYPQGNERKEAVIASFLAGVDLFAIGQTPHVQMDVLEALKEGAASGRITEERINDSLRRIIRAKLKLDAIPQYSLEEAKQIFGSDEHKIKVSRLIED